MCESPLGAWIWMYKCLQRCVHLQTCLNQLFRLTRQRVMKRNTQRKSVDPVHKDKERPISEKPFLGTYKKANPFLLGLTFFLSFERFGRFSLNVLFQLFFLCCFFSLLLNLKVSQTIVCPHFQLTTLATRFKYFPFYILLLLFSPCRSFFLFIVFLLLT